MVRLYDNMTSLPRTLLLLLNTAVLLAAAVLILWAAAFGLAGLSGSTVAQTIATTVFGYLPGTMIWGGIFLYFAAGMPRVSARINEPLYEATEIGQMCGVIALLGGWTLIPVPPLFGDWVVAAIEGGLL